MPKAFYLCANMLKYIIISVLCIFFFACNQPKKVSKQNKKEFSIAADTLNSLTFKDVAGTRFYEVKRRFNNGLSFNKDGFQQEPTWIIEYQYPDTMLAYSPEIKGMEHFYLQFDHGRVYNFAREFFRVIKITKDSLILQRLQVDARKVQHDERSDVFCIYYTKDYIQNKLKTTIEKLRRPTQRDTAFIKTLAARANRNPDNRDSAFAGRQPVQFLPNSKNVSTTKITTSDELTGKGLAYEYMYPEYRLEIRKSYKNFAYRFAAVVDTKGNFYVKRIEGVLKEDEEPRRRLIQGICDVYIKNLFNVVPGQTLGIAHSTEITLNVVGKTTK